MQNKIIRKNAKFKKKSKFKTNNESLIFYKSRNQEIESG